MLANRKGVAVSLTLSAFLLAGSAASAPSPFDTVKGSWGGGAA